MTPDEYRELRERTGGTQEDVANVLGVTRKTLNARENGNTVIRPESEFAIRYLVMYPTRVLREVRRRAALKDTEV